MFFVVIACFKRNWSDRVHLSLVGLVFVLGIFTRLTFQLGRTTVVLLPKFGDFQFNSHPVSRLVGMLTSWLPFFWVILLSFLTSWLWCWPCVCFPFSVCAVWTSWFVYCQRRSGKNSSVSFSFLVSDPCILPFVLILLFSTPYYCRCLLYMYLLFVVLYCVSTLSGLSALFCEAVCQMELFASLSVGAYWIFYSVCIVESDASFSICDYWRCSSLCRLSMWCRYSADFPSLYLFIHSFNAMSIFCCFGFSFLLR